ncbi:hypothetical protein [Mesorhizobium sp. B2-1-3A]|uniref:hypothetical protein n=1 Tax=Mesorhizobium sp. B2-1-3A TaxID=2589971 RepID=UPI0015E34D4E|nr:hypothetical protein [Mesorhizobium sp. B2-1-3A]
MVITLPTRRWRFGHALFVHRTTHKKQRDGKGASLYFRVMAKAKGALTSPHCQNAYWKQQYPPTLARQKLVKTAAYKNSVGGNAGERRWPVHGRATHAACRR